MDEQTTRKRVKEAEPCPFTRKRLQPKSPSPSQSPLPESHSSIREGQGAAALAAPVLFPPLPLSTTSVVNDTCLVWGDPGIWGSAMPLDSLTSWDQDNTVAETSFATQETARFGVSAPHEELTFPIITGQSGVVAGIGIDGGAGGGEDGGTLPNKSFEKWQAPTHGIPHLHPSSIRFISHPSMSYTDAHIHAPTQAQSTDLIDHFSPGNDGVDFDLGFTSTDFGVAGPSFDHPLVDPPGTSVFPHEKPHVLEGGPSEATSHFQAPYYHLEHAINVDSYLNDDGYHLFGNSSSWYGDGMLGPSIDHTTTVTQFSPHSVPLLAGESRVERGSEIPTIVFGSGVFGSGVSDDQNLLASGARHERPRRPRGQLLPRDREETNKTRKWKACIRCRMQKIRVGYLKKRQ